MADFFSRIFSIPSDSGSSSSNSTDTLSRRTDHHSLETPESPSAPRGRQRRNDEPAFRSTSEPRRQIPKKAARPRQLHTRSLSKMRSKSAVDNEEPVSESPNESERDNTPSTSQSSVAVGESQKKVKKVDYWQRLTGGVKKHWSPTSVSAPKRGKNSSQSTHTSKIQHDVVGTNRRKLPSSPINVGDSIVISQKYLQESTEISVLTLPKELTTMREDAVLDEDSDFLQELVQTRVLNNNEVQAFLEQRHFLLQHGTADNKETIKNDDLQQGAIREARSQDSRGPLYERIRVYANRLLEEESTANHSGNNGERAQHVDAPQCVSSQHVPLVTNEVQLYETLSNPTKKQSEHSPNTNNSPQSSSNVTPPPPPPPPPPYELQDKNPPEPRTSIPAETLVTLPIDSPGDLSSQPLSKPSEIIDDGQGPFDELSCSLDVSLSSNDGKNPIKQPFKQPRSYKAVTFCLPSPLTYPPAPPFIGPTKDYYYSMERQSREKLPYWSSSPPIIPPIIELWASVENSLGYGLDKDFGGGIIDAWNQKIENHLVGEDLPLYVAEDWINVSANRKNSVKSETCEATSNEAPLVSIQEAKTDSFDAILDCNGDDDLHATVDPLKLSASTVSSQMSQWSLRQANKISSSSSDAETMFRYRSQWKSHHGNMSYKPPMLNNENSPSKIRNTATHLQLDDTVKLNLQLNNVQNEQPNHESTHPIALHGRVMRTPYPMTSHPIDETIHSYSQSPMTPSQRLTSSIVASMASAAISIQASTRGMLERQRFNDVREKVLIIQSFVKRFLYRQRTIVRRKLKLSYFPRNWKLLRYK